MLELSEINIIIFKILYRSIQFDENCFLQVDNLYVMIFPMIIVSYITNFII